MRRQFERWVKVKVSVKLYNTAVKLLGLNVEWMDLMDSGKCLEMSKEDMYDEIIVAWVFFILMKNSG